MPGPLPKNPQTRQRRNKASTRALLKAGNSFIEGTPELPKVEGRGEWHPLALAWWDTIWDSPMADEYLWADMPALLRLASLVDDYWKTPTLSTAQEIRLLEREFGLTPLSRRRLEWQVVKTEEAQKRRSVNRRRYDDTDDPREVLS